MLYLDLAKCRGSGDRFWKWSRDSETGQERRLSAGGSVQAVTLS